jgi:hypothetical protein
VRESPTFVHHQPRWKKGFGRRGMDASSKMNLRRKRGQRGWLRSDWRRTSRPPRHLLLYHFHPVGPGEKWQRKVARAKSGEGQEQGPPQLVVTAGLVMSGRLDSNQRPPEPHYPGQECFQPPNVTNASLLETYRFHSSHSLRRSQPKIDDSSTVSRLFRAQACPLWR